MTDGREAPDAEDGGRFVALLPLPLEETFDYLGPEDSLLAPGDLVRVPFGPRRLPAVVWEPDRSQKPVPYEKLKELAERIDLPPFPEVHRRFIEWVARYNMAPRGAVLRMSLSVPDALEPPAPVVRYAITAEGRARLDAQDAMLSGPAGSDAPQGAPAVGSRQGGMRLTKARCALLRVLAEGPPRSATEAAAAAAVSSSVMKGLVGAGWVERRLSPPDDQLEIPDWRKQGVALSPAQAQAADELRGRIGKGYSVTLLDGVTGAGKTEVYLEAVAAALSAGRQVLVLLPEIALSAQWLERFEARFGCPPALWHSELTAARRRLTWRALVTGRARVVVGARSALFLPFPDLGLIVVDEEHDPAFKQEDGVIYQARDMAVVRAHLGAFPIVLASATPSLETVVNVKQGRYGSISLPDRHGGADLPEIRLIDLRRHPPPRIEGHGQSWISAPLREAIAAALEKGEQALLFLNRRGYAPLTLCRACGHRINCPNCTAWLVEHRHLRRLQCHHCGYAAAHPDRCPACQAEDSLAACGPGVERLAEEIARLFPKTRVRLVASDTLTGPGAAAQLYRAIRDHEVDILIGTQVLAKGHHFPGLTLVGVVDADLGLYGGDLRAAERSYQLLHQVAGRSGRAKKPGLVFLQTAEPEHPVMQALAGGTRDAFYETEAAQRQQAGMPPFGRLAALILSSRDAQALDELAAVLARTAPRGPDIQVLGPAPAPMAILRGRHRRRFLFKSGRDTKPQAHIVKWLASARRAAARRPGAGKVRVQVDIDPYAFL